MKNYCTQKNFQQVNVFCKLFGLLHAYQIEAIRMFIIGALHAVSVVPATVGRAVRSCAKPCHSIKRMYRLLWNERLSRSMLIDLYCLLAPRCIGIEKEIIIAMDWTTLHKIFNLLSIALVTQRGRSIPLAYDGYEIGNFKEYESQNIIEENFLRRILAVIPEGISVTVIADRGFDRPEIPKILKSLGIHFVVRVSVGSLIQKTNGKWHKLTKETIGKGQKIDFGTIKYTQSHPVTVRLVGAWDKKMKEAWLLVTDHTYGDIQTILDIYACRMEIEEMFKSKKNGEFGFHWSHSKLQTIDRWLRLAFLTVLLFQILAEIAFSETDWKKIENNFTLCRRKSQVFSFYRIALFIVKSNIGNPHVPRLPI